MSYETLPFKDYTVMSNNLMQNLGCSDVYRTYVLLLTADKTTLKTDTTLGQLAVFVGDEESNYKKGKTSKSFNDKLRETGEVSITDKDSGRTDRHWTDYTFLHVMAGHYRRIGREFYDNYNTLDLKLRGFILKLFSVTEPHSYIIKTSMRELKNLIHMGHDTINSQIKILKDLDLLEEVGDCKVLKVKGLRIDIPKDSYVEEMKAIFEHMIMVNESNNIPLSRECMIYKKYKENDFKSIKNMYAFMKRLINGTIGRKTKTKEKVVTDIIM
ncbi:MAG: hypothetical protein RR061_04130 [Muribaculaceae bacterium]